MSASSEYLNVLTRLTESQGQQQAEAVRAKAQATAEAQRQNAQIWGQTISNLGQYVSQIPSQMLEAQKAKQEAAMNQAKLDALKQAQSGQQNVNQILSTMMADGPDGIKTLDRNKLRQAMSSQNVPLNLQADTLKSLDDVDASLSKFQQSKIDHTADIANSILSTHKAEEPITPEAVHLGLAIAKANGLTDDDSIAKINDLLAQGADPRQVLMTVRNQSEKYKPKSDEYAYGANVGIYSKNTGDVKTPASNSLKTVTELRIDAANPKSPTQAQSAEILKNMPASETVSGPAEDERYRVIMAKPPQARTPEERAWSAAYEKQKTLGIDTSASFAAARQAASIDAQTKQQGRAQAFQESQAGRKELTDKVEQPYQTAQSGVDTLRETIQAAKDGNVVAGQLQSLLTTMATLKAEGFNRINTAEINATGDAGSMFQRIEGWFSHATAGQPIPPSVQKDMASFADILEKAAYKKYQSGFQTTTKRYGLTDEQPLPPPQSAAPVSGGAPKEGETKPIPGYPGTEQTYRNGKWIRTK